jgi:hypothetical protein
MRRQTATSRRSFPCRCQCSRRRRKTKRKTPPGGATSGCTSSQSLLLVTVFKVFLHLSFLCLCGLDLTCCRAFAEPSLNFLCAVWVVLWVKVFLPVAAMSIVYSRSEILACRPRQCPKLSLSLHSYRLHRLRCLLTRLRTVPCNKIRTRF